MEHFLCMQEKSKPQVSFICSFPLIFKKLLFFQSDLDHALQTFNGTHWKTLPTKFEPISKHAYNRGKIVFIPEDDTKVYFVGGVFERFDEKKQSDKIWEYDLVDNGLKELSHRIPMNPKKLKNVEGIVNHGAVGVRLDGNEKVGKTIL